MELLDGGTRLGSPVPEAALGAALALYMVAEGVGAEALGTASPAEGGQRLLLPVVALSRVEVVGQLAVAGSRLFVGEQALRYSDLMPAVELRDEDEPLGTAKTGEGYVGLARGEDRLEVDGRPLEGQSLALVYGDGPGQAQRVVPEGADDLGLHVPRLLVEAVALVVPGVEGRLDHFARLET